MSAPKAKHSTKSVPQHNKYPMIPIAAVLLGALVVVLMIGSVGLHADDDRHESVIHETVADAARGMDHLHMRYRVKQIENMSDMRRQSIPFRWARDDGTYNTGVVVDGLAVSDDHGYSVIADELRRDLASQEYRIREIVDSTMISHGFVPDATNTGTLYAVLGYTRGTIHCAYNLRINGDSPYVLACAVGASE